MMDRSSHRLLMYNMIDLIAIVLNLREKVQVGLTQELKKTRRSRFSLLSAVLVLSASVAMAQNEPPPSTVGVVTVTPETIVLTATLPGRIVASAVAEVRPQVNGIIIERLFTEGAHVEKGDVLFKIDAATYEATVAQAQAAVSAANAQFKVAEQDASRVQKLADRNVSSRQELDEAIAARDVAAASIGVAKAQLKSAQIELERTTITASLSGEIGLALTTQGALVTASQANAMTTIRNIDTVFVDVTVSASRLLAWRRAHLDKEVQRTVTLKLSDGVPYSHTGLLTAAEPQVNPQTSAVVLRMEFPNPDHLLLPGTYVKVDVQTDTVDGAFVVSQSAVGRDRQGRPTALVVNADDVVEQRLLTVLQDRGNTWIVKEGLAAGERVVVDGKQKATPGAKVSPQEMPLSTLR